MGEPTSYQSVYAKYPRFLTPITANARGYWREQVTYFCESAPDEISLVWIMLLHSISQVAVALIGGPFCIDHNKGSAGLDVAVIVIWRKNMEGTNFF